MLCVVVLGAGCGGGGGEAKDGGRTDAATHDGHTDSRKEDALNPVSDAHQDTSLDGASTRDASTSDAAGTSDGAIPVDGGAVPTDLTATVLDRRQTSFHLVWPAPATASGAKVSGYEVRVAKQPITAQNFDDTAVTLAETYAGTPAAPGQADKLDVKNLNIEQPYYFAVVGKDAAGTRGTILATATAVQAQFQTTILSGTGTDGIGEDLDGSGDFGTASNLSFTADGFSDLIVGDSGGKKVYVYFGSATGYASLPGITISGSVADFGKAVANAGDLDGDGLADLAIASPGDGGGGKVYIFSRKNPPSSWGTSGKWPATLTDTQANYVLTADATYAGGIGSIQPRQGLARLGNFDGTGSDDLAVGLALHASANGGLLIVKGSTSFASGTIPDTTGAQTIEIDGTATGGLFGFATVGIGPFFGASSASGLVASAPAASAIYGFPGQTATTPLTAAAASNAVTGVTADVYGLNLGFLGQAGGSPGAVTVAAPNAGYVDVYLGNIAKGPLLGGGQPAASFRLRDTAAGNSFGVVNVGGGIKGTSQSVSLIGGDAVPDLVVAGQAEAGSPVYILSGAVVGALTGTVDISAAPTEVVPPIVKVLNRFPSGWGGYAGTGIVVDSNGDGYGDFAIGEFAPGGAGRVVVFY